jgi:hypothetical protein
MRYALFFLACVVATPVCSQIIRCQTPSGVVYQQSACQGGQKVNTSGAGVADPGSRATQTWKHEIALIERKERGEKAIAEGKVFVGMTKDEVIKSWGTPTRVNKTTTSGGSTEQWVYYGRGGSGSDQYVYVDNGVVRTVQSRE